MEVARRTRRPWPTWVKGALALAVMAAAVLLATYAADEGPDLISVEQALNAEYGPGDPVQVGGEVRNLTREDFLLAEGDHTLRVLLGNVTIPETFAENKGATITGELQMVEGELVLVAEKIQVGCPSKYVPAEEE